MVGLDTIAKYIGQRALESFWKRFSASARLHAAVESSREEVFDDMVLVCSVRALESTGAPFGTEPARAELIRQRGRLLEKARNELHEFACSPSTHRRFLALWSEALRSDSERVMMLTTVFLAETGATSLRSRLDWAVCQLQPEDVMCLRAIIKAVDMRGLTRGFVALEDATDSSEALGLELVVGDDERDADLGITVPARSMRALQFAQCIRFGEPVLNEKTTHYWHGVGILALGRELDRLASTIDWVKVAHERRTGVINA